ncbi:MAG: hypothetical protein PHQ43_06940 [Dehalococcoidales bacterium]|nr:hypothetical protein [Dehalococcoidales bacterium]
MVNNMGNQDMQNQVDMFRQMSQQQGVSGVAYIDIYPASGSLRYKLKVTPPERRAEMIANISLILEMMSQAFNLQTKKITNKEADNG